MAKRGYEFSDEEKERALTALALVDGNTTRAHDLLKNDETLTRTPSRQVLDNWKRDHADRYEQIREQRRPDIERAAVNDYAAIVATTNQAHLQLVSRTLNGIHDLDAKDAAAAAKNLAIAGGVAADKLLVFTDRPNQITERRDPEQILRQIETLVGTAEEITNTEPDRSTLLAESGSTNPRELPA